MPIVPQKPLTTVEGRGIHFIASGKSESCRQRRADKHGERVAWNTIQYRESERD